MNYNWNLWENSEICPNFDNMLKYAELWLDTDIVRYKEFALNACVECLNTEYSALSKDNQQTVIYLYNQLQN